MLGNKLGGFEYDRVYELDCLEGLHRIPDNCCPLLIADSPYGIGKDFGMGIIWNDFGEWFVWIKELLLEFQRVLHPEGSLFLYASHENVSHLDVFLREMGLQYRRKIIWHYENGMARQTKTLITEYEPILWFTKSETYYYRTIREPYKSTDRIQHKIIKKGRVWQPNPEGRKAGDVWKTPTLAGKRFESEKVDHPTQKPLALCDRIVTHFSKVGDLVIVPFGGSGSECVSCKKFSRKFIAFEINPYYIRISNQRLATTKSLEPSEIRQREKYAQSSLGKFIS